MPDTQNSTSFTLPSFFEFFWIFLMKETETERISDSKKRTSLNLNIYAYKFAIIFWAKNLTIFYLLIHRVNLSDRIHFRMKIAADLQSVNGPESLGFWGHGLGSVFGPARLFLHFFSYTSILKIIGLFEGVILK